MKYLSANGKETLMMARDLSPQATAKFKAQIEAHYAALLDEIESELRRSRRDSHVELAGRVRDMAEDSVADLVADLEIGDLVRHSDELFAIKEALDRIASGAYGTCVDCGEPIGLDRLNAQPTAKRCYVCKIKHESVVVAE
ncbi:MAG: TraR/DksA family transcriptional regulator [Pseudomonadota bacterium]|nr:MAG: TraR/DksA family transcriptional regulator [Pseudomonadota bacterium]